MQISSKFPEKPWGSLCGVRSANLLQIYLENQSRDFWDAAGSDEFSTLEGLTGGGCNGGEADQYTAQKGPEGKGSHRYCSGHTDGQQEAL